MNVEEDHLDILQNIEFAIISVYKDEPLLMDFDVENVVNALIMHCQAQAQKRDTRLPNLNERARQVYELVETMCEWRLGNDAFVSEEMRTRAPSRLPWMSSSHA
jgi:hypothetical protein